MTTDTLPCQSLAEPAPHTFERGRCACGARRPLSRATTTTGERSRWRGPRVRYITLDLRHRRRKVRTARRTGPVAGCDASRFPEGCYHKLPHEAWKQVHR